MRSRQHLHTDRIGRYGGGITISLPTPHVSFVSQSAVVTATRTNTVIPAPANIQNGDVLVLLFYIENVAPTPPTGFTAFTNLGPLAFPVDAAALWAWRKVANNEAGDYTITHLNTFSNAVMLVYRKVNTSSIEDVAPSTRTDTANPIHTANSVNIVTQGSRLIFVSAAFNFLTVNRTPPDLLTERYDSQTADPNGFGLYVADGIVLSPGATGNKSVSNNASANDWAASLISLRLL